VIACRETGAGVGLDRTVAARDDVPLVEFATPTAVLSLLTTSLGTLQQGIASRLVVSDSVALSQASKKARENGAPVAGTRAAYAAAPYRKPALRYVYSLGWIAGTRHKAVCALSRLDLQGSRSTIISTLRKSPQALNVVRKLRLTVPQAGTAFAAGFASACG
jgi:hypothetical protein